MKRYLPAIAGLAFLTILACDSSSSRLVNGSTRDSTTNEVVIPYQPDAGVGKDRRELFLQSLGKNMFFPKMSDGSKGLFLRIWIWDFDTNYVVNITDDGGRMRCSVTAFNSRTIDSAVKLIILKQWTGLSPASGWPNFTRVLHDRKITALPGDMSTTHRKQYLTHMTYVQVEVANMDGYRFYEYLEPSFYRTLDPGANNIYYFLKHLSAEIGVNLYRVSEKMVAAPD